MRKLSLSTLFAFALLIGRPDTLFADDALKIGDAYDYPPMYLNIGINSSQTNKLTIAEPIRNGSAIVVPATSGALVQLSRGAYTETIYASRLAVNQNTGVITLTGTVIRDVCFNQARTFVTCSSGQTWAKGTEVKLIDSGKRFNRFVDSTRSNVLNASGSIVFQGSGSLAIPTFATTTERDRQLGATPGGPVRTACVTGDACYYYLGNSWIRFGSGSSVSATTTVRGGVELATPTDIQNNSLTGDSGAPLAISTSIVTRTSTGSTQAYKVPALGSNGALSPGVGGTGLSSLTQSGVLIGNGVNSVNTVTASSGQTLKANSKGAWFSANPSPLVLKSFNGVTDRITAGASTQNFTNNYQLSPSQMGTGAVFELSASGTGSSFNSYHIYRLRIGTTTLCATPSVSTVSQMFWSVIAHITILKSGAVSKIHASCVEATTGGTATNTGSVISVDTTTAQTIQMSLESNGSNAYSYMTQFLLLKW